MPPAAPSGSYRPRPYSHAGARPVHPPFGPRPSQATLHGLARDRLRYALIVREARYGPAAPWIMPTTAATARAARTRAPAATPVEEPQVPWAAPPAVAPAPLVIEPVVPPPAPTPPPAPAPPAQPRPAAAARGEAEPQPISVWIWPTVALSVLILAATAWLVGKEWRWLSLPLDRRASLARTIVDGWNGPGAYSRIDGENKRLFGRDLS